MSIKSFVQHSGWQEMVSLCSLIRLIGVCADCEQLEFLCSHSDSGTSESHVATAGGCQRLLTHYRRREVRNSIYRYGKIYIDYRSKFSYRFISSISIIYGNTTILALVWFRDIQLGGISQEITQPSVTKVSLKITHPKFHLNLPGANELNCWKCNLNSNSFAKYQNHNLMRARSKE